MLLLLVFTVVYFILKQNNDPEFFQSQLLLSRLFLAALAGQFLAVLFARRSRIGSFLSDYFTEPGSAYTLAFFRIILFGILALVIYPYSSANAYYAGFPSEARVPLPFMGWYIESLPITPLLYKTIAIITAAACLFACLGLFTRVALTIAVVGCFYVIGVPFFFGKLFHRHMWLWIPIIFWFSPCADAWSLDSYIKKKFRNNHLEPAPDAAYALPFRLIWLHFGIIYTFSGIIKLWDCGLEWALGDNALNQIYTEWLENNYKTIPSIRIDHYPALVKAGALGVIVFEISYLFLVFKPPTRLLCFFGGLALHNITDYLMNISFRHLQILYIFWLNPVKLFKKEKKITARISFGRLINDNKFKYTFLAGMILWSLNSLCGLFKVHSWPFSAYPSYSVLAPSKPYYLKIEIKKDNRIIDFDDLAESRNFHKEKFRYLEWSILNAVKYNHEPDAIKEQILKLWRIYQGNFPELNSYDVACFYFEQKSLVPEQRHISYDQIPFAESYGTADSMIIIPLPDARFNK